MFNATEILVYMENHLLFVKCCMNARAHFSHNAMSSLKGSGEVEWCCRTATEYLRVDQVSESLTLGCDLHPVSSQNSTFPFVSFVFVDHEGNAAFTQC